MKKKTLFISTLAFYSVLSYAQTIETVAGNSAPGWTGDGGAATTAELNAPPSVALDTNGNIYIADQNNNIIRKVSSSTGIITTIVANGAAGFFGDGGPAGSAELNAPTGVAVDDSGNIYIADHSNDEIRKVTVSTGIITRVAGMGMVNGYYGDGGPATAAEIFNPYGLTLDGSHNVYIADQYNMVIRKVTASNRKITTIAGNFSYGQGYSGDNGPATLAELNYPTGVTLDDTGNVFICDNSNNVIRKVSISNGKIRTVVGNGIAGYYGNGGQASLAELTNPTAMEFGKSGNMYITDQGNDVIREVTTSSGIISTFAGIGIPGYSGNGGPAISAEFNWPTGLAIDSSGNMYIADVNNNVIRKIYGILSTTEQLSYNSIATAYPNPNTGEMNIKLSGSGYSCLKLYDVFGREVFTRLLDAKESDLQFTINAGNLSNGVYFMQIENRGGIISKQVVMEK